MTGHGKYPLESPFRFKTVLVHGATSGLGLAMAEAFLLAGVKVLATGRRREKLDELEMRFGDRVKTYQMDAMELDKLKEFAERVVRENPEMNGVILSSGIQRQTNFVDPSAIDLNTLDEEIATNYTSFLHLIVHLLPHLQTVSRTSDAYLAIVTSGLALVPLPTCANYCATKSALHHLVLAMREQLTEPFPNLHIIEIFPPLVASELHDAKHQPEISFDKMKPSDREKMGEMPVDEFIVELFAGFDRGERDIPVGTTKAAFEKLEVGSRFKLLEMMRPRFRFMMEKLLGFGGRAGKEGKEDNASTN